jgi:hypothetical protein
VKNTIQPPYHVGLGTYINTKCDGVTSLRPELVGTETNFLDVNKAHRDGYFGDKARIWGDADWSLLLDYLSGGVACSQQEWDALTWQPQVLAAVVQERNKALPWMKKDILLLKNRSLHQGDFRVYGVWLRV